MKTQSKDNIKSGEEIQIIREGSKILSSIVEDLKGLLIPGAIAREIDARAESLIRERGVIPAFKGYRGFPSSVCLSINNEVVHGIPNDRSLAEGDVASLDIGLIYKDYYADTAVTVGVGNITREIQKLLDVTRSSLYKGIEQAKVNNHLSDVSHAIQTYVEANDFSIVRDFVGHGIGKNLHEDPEIPNFGTPHNGPILKEGMVLAIEPMVNMGTWKTKILDDGWTVVTQDGERSAHFEHTIVVTQNGPEILTE